MDLINAFYDREDEDGKQLGIKVDYTKYNKVTKIKKDEIEREDLFIYHGFNDRLSKEYLKAVYANDINKLATLFLSEEGRNIRHGLRPAAYYGTLETFTYLDKLRVYQGPKSYRVFAELDLTNDHKVAEDLIKLERHDILNYLTSKKGRTVSDTFNLFHLFIRLKYAPSLYNLKIFNRRVPKVLEYAIDHYDPDVFDYICKLISESGLNFYPVRNLQLNFINTKAFKHLFKYATVNVIVNINGTKETYRINDKKAKLIYIADLIRKL